MNNLEEKRLILKNSYITIFINLILSIVKILCGIFGNSSVLVSDGIHSATDIFSTVAVIIGAIISKREPDENHQYGHEKLECIIAMFISASLLTVAFGIGYNAINSILSGSLENFEKPSIITLIAAFVSIAAKEGMYRYTLSQGRKIKSPSLEADAWHHRSDALSSIGSLIGIGGAMIGIFILDPIASLLICVLIVIAAVKITKVSISQLVDQAADKETISKIKSIILEHPEVMNIDDLINKCSEIFGSSKTEVVSQNYQHSNNRNSTPKKVNEYLILCEGR